MWLSVVCTLVDNDTPHYSSQNVVQQMSYITKRTLCFSY